MDPKAGIMARIDLQAASKYARDKQKRIEWFPSEELEQFKLEDAYIDNLDEYDQVWQNGFVSGQLLQGLSELEEHGFSRKEALAKLREKLDALEASLTQSGTESQ
jgi:hypothetical protein